MPPFTKVNRKDALVAYILIKDQEVAADLFERGSIRDTVAVTVGGKVETVYNRSLEFTGVFCF